MSDLRHALAAVLAGVSSPMALREFPGDALLACSQAEGVSALLAQQMQGSGDVQDPLAGRLRDHARGLAATELAQRAELRRLLSTLDLAGITVLVLKGHALGQWLYPAPYLRESSDIDLLFADREHAEAASDALKALGYVIPYRLGRFAHELPCRRPGTEIDLDMHWALAAMPVLDRLPGFDALRAEAIALPALGASAMGLSPVHALLHACVHRASNLCAGLGDRLKWLYDIHLLAAAFSSEQWNRFADACRGARISGMAASGLMASQAMFATSLPADLIRRLNQDAGGDALDESRLSDWRYVQQRNFAALGGIAKLSWLWEQLFPPFGYLRELYGSELGWFGLMWQRLLRLKTRFTSHPGSAND